MDILPQLLQKYPFFHNTIQNIIVDNTFHFIDTIPRHINILFVYDNNIHTLVATYRPSYAFSLNLDKPKAHPEMYNVSQVIFNIHNYNISIVIGMGTGSINDICKYATFLTNIDYVFIPTALSMNGIVSQNASLLDGKSSVKQSLITQPPRSIILDKNILLSAPKVFIGSAIMDSLAGYTACNDFIYASKTDGIKYLFEQRIFNIFDKKMSEVIQIVNNDIKLIYQDFDTILQIFELLYISGMIMNYYGSSIAFSGGEHHIAHTLESMVPKVSKKFLHGEIISAILPFYTKMQQEYIGDDYIKKDMILHNTRFNFTAIANKLNMQVDPTDLGISMTKFHLCVKDAKNAKERPTILNLLF